MLYDSELINGNSSFKYSGDSTFGLAPFPDQTCIYFHLLINIDPKIAKMLTGENGVSR